MGRQEDVKVYFRVDNIYKKAEIQVTCGDRVVLSRKKAVVTPGEMESLTLKKEQLADCQGEQLDFRLKV